MNARFFTAMFLAASGAQVYAEDKIQVDVYMNEHDESGLILTLGKRVASRLFDRSGVHLNWHWGNIPAAGVARPGATRLAFAVRTAEFAPDNANPTALAGTRIVGVYGKEITVYQDRLEAFLFAHPSLGAVAAGYVLAHELGHAMQGVSCHSVSGIMKACWSRDDYKDMTWLALAFSLEDVDLIHRGITVQLAGAQSVPTAALGAELALASSSEK